MSEPRRAVESLVGQTIGHFVVTTRVGVGAMGEVYVAEQANIKTRVAIKALLPHISANTEHVERFFNEAIAASVIRHAGIPKVFDVGFTASGRAYLVMEYLEGETLASRIRRAGRLSLGQLCDVGRQIANVLDATHQAGITHRDLKPENIFLVPDAELDSGERVKILDFGIAKLGRTRLTGTSTHTMGTPDYMAPEQWQSSHDVDWRADAYSLGCVVFEMATGRVPFPAESIPNAYAQHLEAEPPSILELVPSLPRELDELVGSLLEKDPDDRPVAMKDVTRAFALLGEGQPRPLDETIAPPPATARSNPSRRFGRGAAPSVGSGRALLVVHGTIGLVLVGILVALVALLRNRDEVVIVEEPPYRQPPAPSLQLAATSAPADAGVDAPEPARRGPPTRPSAPPAARRPPHKTIVAVRDPVPPRAADEHAEARPVDPYGEPDAGVDATAEAAPVDARVIPESLDRSSIATGLETVNDRVNECRQGLASPGVVRVHVRVEPNGRVSAVSISQASDSKLGECVRVRTASAVFPETKRGGSFTYPFFSNER